MFRVRGLFFPLRVCVSLLFVSCEGVFPVECIFPVCFVFVYLPVCLCLFVFLYQLVWYILSHYKIFFVACIFCQLAYGEIATWKTKKEGARENAHKDLMEDGIGKETDGFADKVSVREKELEAKADKVCVSSISSTSSIYCMRCVYSIYCMRCGYSIYCMRCMRCV